MTTREAFEAWCASMGFIPTQARYETWQAATDAALERAAVAVEKIDKENWLAWQCAFSKHTAEAIRALKEQQ